MGEAKRKSERRADLLERHRFCCFCGGGRAATTVDHAPARICFKAKIGPEGFELPACEACNRNTALSEQVTAFYIRMADKASTHFHGPDTTKLISAMVNNAPECLPDPQIPANDKRRALREQGVRLARGEWLDEAPVARIPETVHGHVEVFMRKMLAALFYRETGGFLGPGHSLVLQWAQRGTEAAEFSRQNAEDWLGNRLVSTRRNTDLGDQFAYRYAYHPAHGFFGLWMEFDGSFGFFTIAGPAQELAKLADQTFVKPWRPLDDCGRDVRLRPSLIASA